MSAVGAPTEQELEYRRSRPPLRAPRPCRRVADQRLPGGRSAGRVPECLPEGVVFRRDRSVGCPCRVESRRPHCSRRADAGEGLADRADHLLVIRLGRRGDGPRPPIYSPRAQRMRA
jgi:hypothetical protein